MLTIPYELIANIIVLIVFIFAFITAETKGKIILATIAAFLLILPYIFPTREVALAGFVGKAIFGIACYLYLKMSGFLKR